MPKYTIDQIIDYTEMWLVTGELNTSILAEDFQFISPYWQSNDKEAFINKFIASDDYIETSLSNILRFYCIIKLKSDDNHYFTIVLQYHTKNDMDVDEAIIGRVENGLLVMLRTIYDLNKMKEAHNL